MRLLRSILITLLLFCVVYLIAAIIVPPLRYAPQALPYLLESMPARLPVPVAGVPRRALRDTWGAPRSGDRRHEGIDIFAPRNTAITSSTGGIVLFQGWNSLGGRVINIIGPGAYIHYYAHLEGWSDFQPGDKVQAGDIIGYVGNSGNAQTTPCHLHYGIYTLGGTAINPWPYLKPE